MTDTVRVQFCEFTLADVEDPYLMAAEPLSQWQQSEAGAWAMAHSIEKPVFYCNPDYVTYSTRVVIFGTLTETDHTFWRLKYG